MRTVLSSGILPEANSDMLAYAASSGPGIRAQLHPVVAAQGRQDLVQHQVPRTSKLSTRQRSIITVQSLLKFTCAARPTLTATALKSGQGHGGGLADQGPLSKGCRAISRWQSTGGDRPIQYQAVLGIIAIVP